MRDTLEEVLGIDIERPTVAPDASLITYGKGRSPYRAAIVAAMQKIEAEQGLPPGRVLTEIAERLVLSAREGDKHAAYHIADRLDGKPVQDVAMHVDTDTRPLADLTVEELEQLIREQQRVLGDKVAIEAQQAPKAWNKRGLTVDG
jgi:hypothetical protein